MRLWDEDWVVVGVDEAGRGPLAGPVVAGAVAFEPDVQIDGIGDSKLLKPEQRNGLERLIQAQATAWAVAEVDHAVIDRINILQATRLAMETAVRQVVEVLGPERILLLVDGTIPPIGIGRQVNVVKGDRVSFSIGAASILAKEHRDRIMIDYDKQYTGYGFARHKGYCTAAHIEALRTLGPCAIHRRSFQVKALLDNS
ncbi:ribonuclease HII [bacterium]|nr:ribonuclease HII [bacterium]